MLNLKYQFLIDFIIFEIVLKVSQTFQLLAQFLKIKTTIFHFRPFFLFQATFILIFGFSLFGKRISDKYIWYVYIHQISIYDMYICPMLPGRSGGPTMGSLVDFTSLWFLIYMYRIRYKVSIYDMYIYVQDKISDKYIHVQDFYEEKTLIDVRAWIIKVRFF